MPGVFVFALVGGAFDDALARSGAAPLVTAAASTTGSLDWTSILVITLLGTALHVAAALADRSPIRPRERMMTTAFRRVQVLHVAIIAGAFLIAFVGLPSAAGLFLVLLHAAVDVVTWRAPGAAARTQQEREPRHLSHDEQDREI